MESELLSIALNSAWPKGRSDRLEPLVEVGIQCQFVRADGSAFVDRSLGFAELRCDGLLRGGVQVDPLSGQVV
jgi:hypothetical protein